MVCKSKSSEIDIYYLRERVRKITRDIFYSEHYCMDDNESLNVEEGVNLVFSVLSEVTKLDFGEV